MDTLGPADSFSAAAEAQIPALQGQLKQARDEVSSVHDARAWPNRYKGSHRLCVCLHPLCCSPSVQVDGMIRVC